MTTKARRQELCLMLREATLAWGPVQQVWLHDHPAMTITRDSGSEMVVIEDAEDWDAERVAIQTWWSISSPETRLLVGDEVVTSSMLTHADHLIYEGDGVKVYQQGGQGVLYWIAGGVTDWELLGSRAGGDYAVASVSPLRPGQQAEIRDLILRARPGSWALDERTDPSTSMLGMLAVEDCVLGVYRPSTVQVAAWIRQVLPAHKVGVPGVDDVRAKLNLESRLRGEEGVTGSIRPLAITLEAIENPVEAWPGLWQVVHGPADFRSDLPILLVWDAVLHAVAAVNRAHAEFKPGLWYGEGISRTIKVEERRFSKREEGPVESAYCCVNPSRLGAASAARLIQAASHELAHLITGETATHSERFIQRREQLQHVAWDLLPDIAALIEGLGLHHRAARPFPPTHPSIDQWLIDVLAETPVVSTTFLVGAWGALRNLTEGRAARDVEEALAALSERGHLRWSLADTAVQSTYAC